MPIYRICRNKRPGRLIFKSKKKFQNPSVLCTPPPLWKFQNPSESVGFVYSPPPFEKSLMRIRRFCVLPPLKNHCFWWALISANTVIKKTRFMLTLVHVDVCKCTWKITQSKFLNRKKMLSKKNQHHFWFFSSFFESIFSRQNDKKLFSIWISSSKLRAERNAAW